MANSIFLWPSGTPFNNGQTITIGTGTAAAQIGGTLNTQFTPVSNTSIGSQDVLYTYSLPANTLAVNGRGIRITAGGTFAANANAKSARIFFGATQLESSSNVAGSPNAISWRLTADVIRSGAATQTFSSIAAVGAVAAWHNLAATTAETLSGAVVITVTGLSATAATDVTATLFIVEAF